MFLVLLCDAAVVLRSSRFQHCCCMQQHQQQQRQRRRQWRATAYRAPVDWRTRLKWFHIDERTNERTNEPTRCRLIDCRQLVCSMAAEHPHLQSHHHRPSLYPHRPRTANFIKYNKLISLAFVLLQRSSWKQLT